MTTTIQEQVPSLYMNEVYKILVKSANESLPQKVKAANREFLAQFSQFYQESFHNGYLHERKVDWKIKENTCSVCHNEMDLPLSAYKGFFNVSFIDQLVTTGIAVCKNEKCTKKVEEYIEKIQDNFGPFSASELKKVEISTNAFGDEGRNYDNLRAKNHDEKWHFRDLSIQYVPAEEDIVVLASLDKHNRFIHGPSSTNVTLKELMDKNPDRDFALVSKEMPNTIGGRFIKQYIDKHLYKSTQIFNGIISRPSENSTIVKITGLRCDGDINIVCSNSETPYAFIGNNRTHTSSTLNKTTFNAGVIGKLILCKVCNISEASFKQSTNFETGRDFIAFTDPSERRFTVDKDGTYDVVDKGNKKWEVIFQKTHQH